MPADKDGEEFEKDWFGILGCSIGASRDEIERAARKMALKYHPDKNSTADAPEKFLSIQKAKEILLDDSKRKRIEEHAQTLLKRKQYEAERSHTMDDKRKKMRSSFEEKLQKEFQQQKETKEQKTSKDEMRRRLNKIEELKKRNSALIDESVEAAKKQADESFTKFSSMKSNIAKSLRLENSQIKIKWKRNIEHTDESLIKLMSEIGTIEEIQLLGSKGTSALITFTEPKFAEKAVEKYKYSEDYRVSYIEEKTSNTGNLFNGSTSKNDSKKSDFELNMERAVEREHLKAFLGETKNNETKSSDNNLNIDKASFHKKENDVLAQMMAMAAKKKKNSV